MRIVQESSGLNRECTAACVCSRWPRGFGRLKSWSVLAMREGVVLRNLGGWLFVGKAREKGRTHARSPHNRKWRSRNTLRQQVDSSLSRQAASQPAFADHRATDSDSERLHNRSATLTEDQRILLVLFFVVEINQLDWWVVYELFLFWHYSRNSKPK